MLEREVDINQNSLVLVLNHLLFSFIAILLQLFIGLQNKTKVVQYRTPGILIIVTISTLGGVKEICSLVLHAATTLC